MNKNKEILTRKEKGQNVFFRDFLIKADSAVDTSDTNVINFTLTSEEKYKRYDWDIGYYYEVLGHEKGEVNLDRMNNKAPLLYEHDSEKQIGVILKAELNENDKTVECSARFSKNTFPQEVLNDIKDGIRTKMSGGYHINNNSLVYVGKNESDGLPIYRVTDWTLVEASNVSIAADDTVSIKSGDKSFSIRSLFKKKKEDEVVEAIRSLFKKKKEDEVVEDEETKKEDEVAEDEKEEVTETEEKKNKSIEVVDNEKVNKDNRSNEINLIAKSFNFPKDQVELFLKTDKSVEEFADLVKQFNNKKERKNMSNMLNEKELGDFNLFRLLNTFENGGSKEAEISRELLKKTGSNASFMLPPQVLRKAAIGMLKRAYNTGGAGGAVNLVDEYLDAENLIDILRPLLLASKLGMRTVTGLIGDYAVPKKLSGMTSTWVGDSGAGTESSATFGKLVAKPKILASKTEIYELARLQMSPDAQNLAVQDMLASRMQELDRVIFAGTGGATSQPTGVLNLSGVPTIELGANGDVITRDAIIDLYSALGNGNANVDNARLITNWKAKSAMAKTKVDAGSGMFLDGEFRDSLLVTNNIPSNLTKGTGTGLSAMILGDFSDGIIAEWGQPDFMVDKTTGFNEGKTIVMMRQATDVLFRNTQSFAKIVDIKA